MTHSFATYSQLFAALVLTVCVTTQLSSAEPYLPASDDEVLETLPRSLLGDGDDFAQLRQRLASAPGDPDLAAEVASRCLQLGNEAGDPRYYGYARAALKNWWSSPTASPAILQLRAKLKEKDHRYAEALADLRLLVEREPRHAQAWIEIANINRVVGEYSQARHACQQLSTFADELQILLCEIPIQAVTGEANAAYRTLQNVYPKAKRAWPGIVPWLHAMLSQLASQFGDARATEMYFRQGLEQTPDSYYLLRGYADLLLDQDRSEEVLSLLSDHLNDNGILLRYAIAAKRTGDADLAKTWSNRLRGRFEEIRLRGNQPHGRFEARFVLELENDPAKALSIALANWQKQKELRDTRNVLEAAVAARDPEAVQEVIAFVTASRTEDAKLAALIQQLEAL